MPQYYLKSSLTFFFIFVKSSLALLIGSLLLTLIQWYSFFLISQLSLFLFPIILGVIVFILGFIGRALGSIVFGYIGDKISRKLSVILTALTLLIISVLLIVLYSYYTDFCKV